MTTAQSKLVDSILVVDDSVVQRAFAADLCRQLGIAQVLEADGGQSALDILCTGEAHPDVVLLDLEMPGIDGVELAQRMYSEDLLLPVVIISARDVEVIASVERLFTSMGLQVLGALRKPLSRDALLEVLQRYSA